MSTEKQLRYWKSLRGRKLSEETKQKISDSLKGKQPKNVVAGWNKGTKGVMHSWNKGKKCSYLIGNKFAKGQCQGFKHTEKTKQKIREARAKQTFSIETRIKLSESHKGSKSYLWQGGITKENILLRRGLQYALWREAVWQRDNFTCQICGKIGGKIHAHHKYKFSKYPELRFSVQNGITLCKDCHFRLHKEERQNGIQLYI